jgi:hypothetical protein
MVDLEPDIGRNSTAQDSNTLQMSIFLSTNNMTKTKENKIDHYNATEKMTEAECLKYCKKKAAEDVELFPALTFDKDKLVSGYMGMYYNPKKLVKNENKLHQKNETVSD